MDRSWGVFDFQLEGLVAFLAFFLDFMTFKRVFDVSACFAVGHIEDYWSIKLVLATKTVSCESGYIVSFW